MYICLQDIATTTRSLTLWKAKSSHYRAYSVFHEGNEGRPWKAALALLAPPLEPPPRWPSQSALQRYKEEKRSRQVLQTGVFPACAPLRHARAPRTRAGKSSVTARVRTSAGVAAVNSDPLPRRSVPD